MTKECTCGIIDNPFPEYSTTPRKNMIIWVKIFAYLGPFSGCWIWTWDAMRGFGIPNRPHNGVMWAPSPSDGSLERAIGFWSGNLKESTAVGRMRPDGFLHSEWTKKWVKQCHKPLMTGNGLYHPFMVIWGMVSYCFTHIIEDAKRERERGESGRQCDIWKWFLHSGFTGVIPDTILTIPQKSEA